MWFNVGLKPWGGARCSITRVLSVVIGKVLGLGTELSEQESSVCQTNCSSDLY
jgi:hypothetical protein